MTLDQSLAEFDRWQGRAGFARRRVRRPEPDLHRHQRIGSAHVWVSESAEQSRARQEAVRDCQTAFAPSRSRLRQTTNLTSTEEYVPPKLKNPKERLD